MIFRAFLIVSTGFWMAHGQTLLAPKSAPAKYVAPHKPHTKLPDVKAKHAGQQDWREVVVNDEHFKSEYVQSRPGAREPQQLHPDTRAWWIVLDGQIRFSIEGTEPFVASKGSMVQVPMATFFSMETIGERPALRFEVNIAGAKTLYASDVTPPKIPGFEFIPVRFPRKPGVYGANNKPHVTFAELAKKLEAGELKGSPRVVHDARGVANFIYGYEKNLPPFDPKFKGHYHPEGAEFWLIMSGQIRYPIEGQDMFIANEGDVVYVPKFTWHAARWHGPGPSTRLAMNGFPEISHLFEPEK
jgi:mannose-6-phosphate isomerase-like protein (cupin superfamily)